MSSEESPLLPLANRENEMTSGGSHSGVVVGVDGSAPSRRAVCWATRQAMMRNVPLSLVHILSTAVATSPGLMWPGASPPDELNQWHEDEGRKMLAEAISLVKDTIADGADGAVPEVNVELFHSPAVPTLINLSKEARMVVVGSRGRGTMRRVLLGSVSNGLVHHAHCPVAVIHDHAPESALPDTRPVVVGVDGSSASELATEIAFDEASWRGVDLVVMHAYNRTRLLAISDSEWKALRCSAEETLGERLAGFQERYPDVAVRRLIVWGEPAVHLLDQSESAQLLIVGSHGRGGFAEMLLGSVSTAVVNAARIPVIVARRR